MNNKLSFFVDEIKLEENKMISLDIDIVFISHRA